MNLIDPNGYGYISTLRTIERRRLLILAFMQYHYVNIAWMLFKFDLSKLYAPLFFEATMLLSNLIRTLRRFARRTVDKLIDRHPGHVILPDAFHPLPDTHEPLPFWPRFQSLMFTAFSEEATALSTRQALPSLPHTLCGMYDCATGRAPSLAALDKTSLLAPLSLSATPHFSAMQQSIRHGWAESWIPAILGCLSVTLCNVSGTRQGDYSPCSNCTGCFPLPYAVFHQDRCHVGPLFALLLTLPATVPGSDILGWLPDSACLIALCSTIGLSPVPNNLSRY